MSVPRVCVFCLKPPVAQNLEHVLPRWLIALTGTPARQAFFGLTNSGSKRVFAFDQFHFPSCEGCNNQFSDLESKAQRSLERLISTHVVELEDASVLLSWFDKVRVGLWLAHRYLSGDPNVSPKFGISDRIGRHDRSLFIYRRESAASGLRFIGTDTPAFEVSPSCFGLQVGDYIFLSLSAPLTVSKNVGFPFATDMKFLDDMMTLAFVQLGNHYFEVASNLEKARTYYEKAYATSSPKIKSYALYKLAWCDFNAGEHEKALKKLQDTIEFAEKQGKEKSAVDLKNEALQDSVRMFVELNRADDAISYYRAHSGKKKQVRLVYSLAAGLAGAGHHDNAIKSYRYLLDDAPMSESAPDYQQSIIKSFEGLRQRDQVKSEVKKLAELYRPGSEWWKANESKKEVLRNGFNVAEEAMRVTVTEYHQEAQKTKQVDTYRLARDIYKQYVDSFATNGDENFVSDQAFNLKFFYAEILWALEDWDAAAKQYDEVAAFKIPNRPDAKEVSNEKYRQVSAYNSILAYDKLVKIERGQLQKSNLDSTKKIEEGNKKGEKVERTAKLQKRSAKELEEKPISKFEEKLIAACDKYNTLYPKNPDEVNVAYQAAVIYYDKNKFVDAARRFGDIILKYPEDARSQDAADLSMSVLEEKEEWFELNKLSRQFKANAKLTKAGSEFAKRVGTIVEGSQYKYVDEVVYKKEKDPKRAAALFVEFVKDFPKSDNADRALTYAMLIARENNELDKSAELAERVLKEYPISIFDLKVKYTLAKLSEQMASFDKSANMYEEFVQTYDLAAGEKAIGYANIKDLLKKDKEQREKDLKAKKATVVTTVEMKNLKDDARRKEREALIAECTDKKDNWVQNAVFNEGFWFEGVGKFDKAIGAYQRYVLRFKDEKDATEIAYNIGLVLEKANQPSDAIKQYDTFLTTYAKDARVTEARRIDVKYREFLLNQKLKSPQDMERLAKDLIAAYPKLKPDEQKDDRVKLAVAHAKFFTLEPMFKGYTDMKFKKVGTFKSDRPAKEKKLDELLKLYTDVALVGNAEYAIASTTRIGLLYADFASNIAELPDPPGLDEEQVGIFRGELESRYVFPVEEKAVEALEKAVAKSSELSVYNEWTLTAQDRLNKYKPGLYGKAKDVPFRGSEFFATAGAEKKTELPIETTVEKTTPPPGAAPTPGAGRR